MPIVARSDAESATPSAAWLVPTARIGFAAKAVVYLIIGALAVSAALGTGGETTGAIGSIEAIAQQAYGRILVAVMVVGLTCYAVWRWMQLAFDPEGEARDGAGKMRRAGWFFSALAHTFLAITAATVAVTSSSGADGDEKQRWTAELLAQPFGRWLLGVAGLVVIGTGIATFVRLCRGVEKHDLDLSRLGHTGRKVAEVVIGVGLGARGIVFVAIGVLVVRAAWRYDPDEVGGTDEALQLIGDQHYGDVLLLAVAVGLCCYGLLCAMQALLRRFRFA